VAVLEMWYKRDRDKTPHPCHRLFHKQSVTCFNKETLNSKYSSKHSKRKGVVFIYSASRSSHAKSSSHNLKGKRHATKRLRPIRKGTPCSDSFYENQDFSDDKDKEKHFCLGCTREIPCDSSETPGDRTSLEPLDFWNVTRTDNKNKNKQTHGQQTAKLSIYDPIWNCHSTHQSPPVNRS